ncbi:MAG: 23S rRNA (adenine(2503)-C(2))-methyltransferase RlmN [Clostridia bacterium]|nr:23S rRNA (adenine(2503)-C(2))-methyltransferase RlmN [Clostridia bacterium]
MKNLYDLNLNEIASLAVAAGAPRFRGEQIFRWLAKGVESLDEMSNVPHHLLSKISEEYNVFLPKVEKVQKSKDGTKKFLFSLEDGNCIESVFMKYNYGNSICISSQAGCRMGCKFCASTMDGLNRNLTAGEMLGQILAAEKYTGEEIGHVVVMGTGEPLDNYENLSKFIHIVNDRQGKNLGMRNITVSTCGLIPMIDQFAEDFDQVNLAISLHSVRDEVRSNMMPVNNKYSVDQLLEACRRYVDKTHRRITFEYTLVDGVNDSLEDANELADKLFGLNCHVNLIPLNEVKETGLKTTPREKANKFKEALEKRRIQVTIRRELGDDIDGACGQLRLSVKALDN